MLGIAFCLAYLTGTMAMASGLHESTETIASTFDQGPVMFYTDEDLANSFIGSDDLADLEVDYLAFTMCRTEVRAVNGTTAYEGMYTVSILDPSDALGLNMTNESDNSNVLIGTELAALLERNGMDTDQGGILPLYNDNRSTIVYLTAGYPEGAIFADDWLIIPRDKMDELRPDMTGDYSFVMLLGEYERESLPPALQDAESKPTSSVVNFFERGIYQVEADLWAIVLATGIIICLLVYSIMSIETEFNAETIEILRGLGANRRTVIGIFMFKALIITAMGGILGLSMGFIFANAVISGADFVGMTSIIVPLADLKTIFVPLAVSLVGGLVGGFFPSMRASKMFGPRRFDT